MEVSFPFGDAKAQRGMRTKMAIFAALFNIFDFSPRRTLDASLGPMNSKVCSLKLSPRRAGGFIGASQNLEISRLIERRQNGKGLERRTFAAARHDFSIGITVSRVVRFCWPRYSPFADWALS